MDILLIVIGAICMLIIAGGALSMVDAEPTPAHLASGAALGAAMGYFGQCTSGTCPLTSTWWRGALYGGVLGLLFALSSRTG